MSRVQALDGFLGASVFTNLVSSGYSGTLPLVNPMRTEIDYRQCLAAVDDLPEGIDCAALAIPNAGVLVALKACVTRGIGAVTNGLGILSLAHPEVSEIELNTVVAFTNGRAILDASGCSTTGCIWRLK